jgi:hypothetical protein
VELELQCDLAEVSIGFLQFEGLADLLQRIATVDHRPQRQAIQRAHEILVMLAAANDQSL